MIVAKTGTERPWHVISEAIYGMISQHQYLNDSNTDNDVLQKCSGKTQDQLDLP